MACRIFSLSMWDLVPQPGIKPRPSAVEVLSLSHWNTREVPAYPVSKVHLIAKQCSLMALEAVCLDSNSESVTCHQVT